VEVFGFDPTAAPFTKSVLNFFGQPNGILYNADGSLKTPSQVIGFFNAVQAFRTEILKPENQAANNLLKEVFGIDLSDGVSLKELKTFGGPNGILYNAD